MFKKILFLCPVILLTVLSNIWYFIPSGRWYYYRDEWQFLPLWWIHLLLPIFYLVACIIAIIKRATTKDELLKPSLFYIIAPICIIPFNLLAIVVFAIATSGA